MTSSVRLARAIGWVALFTAAGATVAAPLTSFGSCAVEPNKRQICVDQTLQHLES